MKLSDLYTVKVAKWWIVPLVEELWNRPLSGAQVARPRYTEIVLSAPWEKPTVRTAIKKLKKYRVTSGWRNEMLLAVRILKRAVLSTKD